MTNIGQKKDGNLLLLTKCSNTTDISPQREGVSLYVVLCSGYFYPLIRLAFLETKICGFGSLLDLKTVDRPVYTI